jgi:hypothetical protein
MQECATAQAKPCVSKSKNTPREVTWPQEDNQRAVTQQAVTLRAVTPSLYLRRSQLDYFLAAVTAQRILNEDTQLL